MTDWTFEDSSAVYRDRASIPRKIFTRTAPVVAAFSFSAVVALRLAGGLAEQAYAPAAAPQLAPKAAPQQAADAPVSAEKTPARAQVAAAAANPFGALFDPDGSLVGVPALFARNEPLGPDFSPLQGQPLFAVVDPQPQLAPEQQQAAAETPAQPVAQAPQPQVAAASVDVPTPPLRPSEEVAEAAPDAVPLPPARMQVAEAAIEAPTPPTRPAELSLQPRAVEAEPPHENAPTRRQARALRNREVAPPANVAQNDPGSIFDKLFGNSHADQPRSRKGAQLAYAAPDAGGFNLFGSSGNSSPSPVTASGGTAVYNIAAHTVTLPSGRTLEAHSGLGPYFDDPGHVHVRMRGSTPPAIYSLKPREAIFHGVKALRLTPINGSVYGRSGLLAHTFMLGQRGDSNGCVSFRNYRAFLEAYESGEVRRLAVIPGRS